MTTISLPTSFTAVHAPRAGGAEILTFVKEKIMAPTTHHVLIQVEAAGVNRPDILQRQGLYPPPPHASPHLGLEVCGLVVACGPDVKNFHIGDRVIALLTGGGYATYALADEVCCLPIPDHMDATIACAIPETFFTVWHNVFQIGKAQKHETLLIHGGASGIGTTALQMAKAFGLRTITTAGSDEKCAACLQIGADFAINYQTQDFVKIVQDITQGHGVNLILDMVGGDYVSKNYQIAAIEARILQIAFLKGAQAQINLPLLMQKRLLHTGSTLRNRPRNVKEKIAQDLFTYIWPRLNTQQIKPIVNHIFDFKNVVDAHKLMESHHHIGKIVLQIA